MINNIQIHFNCLYVVQPFILQKNNINDSPRNVMEMLWDEIYVSIHSFKYEGNEFFDERRRHVTDHFCPQALAYLGMAIQTVLKDNLDELANQEVS